MRELDQLLAFLDDFGAPDTGFRFRGYQPHEPRYDEHTGERYIVDSRPAEATLWGSKAEYLSRIHGEGARRLAEELRALAQSKP